MSTEPLTFVIKPVPGRQCGWLKDKYGLSWQIAPTVVAEMLKDHESAKAQPVMEAVLRMKKIDIGDFYSDARKIDRVLGWKSTTPFSDGLARTVDYYRNHKEHYL